ncbi:MAG: hypothetical protein BGO29_00230 [Bacteroidales bacterium 36-12]|nr:MAG: hypothetical protein BGO29_00230 [Bacteroidales bacterium 36-12]
MAGMFSMVNAQELSKAIGLRGGGGGEISYLHPLGDATRMELDLGFNWGSIMAHGTYQWVKDLSSVTEGLNWFYGAGAGLGFYTVPGISGFTAGIVGQIGVEYNLPISLPLMISLDYRPGVYFVPFAPNITGAFGGVYGGIRYKF